MARGRREDRVERFRGPQRRMRPPPEAGGGGRGLTAPAGFASEASTERPVSGPLAMVQVAIDGINAVMIALSALAAGIAGCVLTWEVAGRYFFKIPSDWQ